MTSPPPDPELPVPQLPVRRSDPSAISGPHEPALGTHWRSRAVGIVLTYLVAVPHVLVDPVDIVDQDTRGFGQYCVVVGVPLQVGPLGVPRYGQVGTRRRALRTARRDRLTRGSAATLMAWCHTCTQSMDPYRRVVTRGSVGHQPSGSCAESWVMGRQHAVMDG
jgi:hypothetical protein